MLRKAIFLDKDGTLVENVPYNARPEKIRLIAGVARGLKALHRAGFQLIVVTNQPGIAYERFSEEDLGGVEARLRQLLAEKGVPLAGFYYCPHHPEATVRRYAIHCFCRKPSPGLLFRAAREHQLNLSDSWIVGDILDDVEAGRRADCRAVLIDNGNETVWRMTPLRRPHHVAGNFLEAAQAILSNESLSRQVAMPPRPAAMPGFAGQARRGGTQGRLAGSLSQGFEGDHE